MKKTTLVKFLLVTASLSIQIVFPWMRSTGQSGDLDQSQPAAYSISPVARPHQPVPGGGRFFNSQNAFLSGSHALNGSGEVAICSSIGTDCFFGVYLISAANKTTLADYCSQTALGPFSLIMSANINDHGQAAIGGWTRRDIASPTVPAIFISSGGSLTKVATIGDLPPDGTVFNGGFTAVYNAEAFGPAINGPGDVAFYAGGQNSGGNSVGGVFIYSTAGVHKVIQTGDPCPTGGTFDMNAQLSESLHINDKGQVLFASSVSAFQSFGFFLAGPDGVTKVIQLRDLLPNGDPFFAWAGTADLNNNGQVVFPAPLFSASDALGLFLYSDGRISKVAATGDPTPIGGQFDFSAFTNKDIQRPRINDNGDIAFSAPLKGAGPGRAIFVASGLQIAKVVAIGDRLPTGERITELGDFSFNDGGQVSFLAFGKNRPLGIYLATPARQ
jgi:hypothetical protein